MLSISGNTDLSTLLQFLLKVRRANQKKKKTLSSSMKFQIKNEFMTFQNGKQDQNLLMIQFAQYRPVMTVLLSDEILEKYLNFLYLTFNCLESSL